MPSITSQQERRIRTYQAFAREEENKLKAARGNEAAQVQILEEWRAKAAATYQAGTADFRKAMAQIQAAALQAL